MAAGSNTRKRQGSNFLPLFVNCVLVLEISVDGPRINLSESSGVAVDNDR